MKMLSMGVVPCEPAPDGLDGRLALRDEAGGAPAVVAKLETAGVEALREVFPGAGSGPQPRTIWAGLTTPMSRFCKKKTQSALLGLYNKRTPRSFAFPSLNDPP